MVSQLLVDVKREDQIKPFLGGYRHKKTGAIYHHASTTTLQVEIKTVETSSCQTQTAEMRHNIQQTANSTSTQMTGIGIFVSNIQDKRIKPRPYIMADEAHRIYVKKVGKIKIHTYM